ncbi:SEC14 domain and spectrin repeat-containing protein 1-B-like [Glandiceps talaboti]
MASEDGYDSSISVGNISGIMEYSDSEWSLPPIRLMTWEKPKAMEAAQIIEVLRSRVAYLSGGKDRHGGPIISIPNLSDPSDLSAQDFASCIAYLAKIPSDEAKSQGFTVLIDARGSSWNNVRPVLKLLQEVLMEKVYMVGIVKPEAFWEKQKAGQSLKREKAQLGFEVMMFSSVAKLTRYVDPSQLTADFGGYLIYNHSEWLQSRMDYEKFVKETVAMLKRLDQAETELISQLQDEEPIKPEELLWQHQRLKDKVVTQPNSLIMSGQKLLRQLQQDKESGFSQGTEFYQTEDQIIMRNHAKRLLDQLQAKQMKLEQYLDELDRELVQHVKLGDLRSGIKRVVDWILGPGEKLLASQHDIGTSYNEADKLRREHEKLELKCTDTYGMYAELRHVASTLIKENHPSASDIHSQRDYMDTVCRSYASRLERRRNLLITSVRFHRLVQDVLSNLEDFLGLLQSDIVADDVESAQKALRKLHEKWSTFSLIVEQAIREGHALLDMMSETVKNAFGKDITPDYTSHKDHVQRILDELQGRKLTCDEMAEVRKLKLQQILQLRTCERDADQAIIWLLELCDVMVKTHIDIGHTAMEAEHLKREHLKFENTAKGTYEYGKQLLQAALVLRRSLHFDLTQNHERAQKLARAWRQFSHAIGERSSRLSVSYTFHRNTETLIDRLDDFMWTIWPHLRDSHEDKRKEILQPFTQEKEQLMKHYVDTVAMGRALLERLSLPVIATERVPLGPGVETPEEYKATARIIRRLIHRLESKKNELEDVWNHGKEPQPRSRTASPGRRVREVEYKKEVIEIRYTGKGTGDVQEDTPGVVGIAGRGTPMQEEIVTRKEVPTEMGMPPGMELPAERGVLPRREVPKHMEGFSSEGEVYSDPELPGREVYMERVAPLGSGVGTERDDAGVRGEPLDPELLKRLKQGMEEVSKL